MKMVIEKHICDVCGREVTTEHRITVELNTFNSWSDDATIDNQVKKDVCQDCYDAWMALFNMGKKEDKIEEEPEIPVFNTTKKRTRNSYDKSEVLKLWAMGLKYHEIAKKLNISRATVNNCLYMASDEAKAEAKEKYGVHHKPIKEEPKMHVVTDENGIVQVIERV